MQKVVIFMKDDYKIHIANHTINRETKIFCNEDDLVAVKSDNNDKHIFCIHRNESLIVCSVFSDDSAEVKTFKL